jgi:hypothetical protein
MRVSALVRTFGHAQTEIWGATEWNRFKEIMHQQPKRSAKTGRRRVHQ